MGDLLVFSRSVLCATLDRNVQAVLYASVVVQDDTKKRELLKNPTKMEEIQEKKIIDRN